MQTRICSEGILLYKHWYTTSLFNVYFVTYKVYSFYIYYTRTNTDKLICTSIKYFVIAQLFKYTVFELLCHVFDIEYLIRNEIFKV